jgi:peptide/nickel transport system ATP-binding protein
MSLLRIEGLNLVIHATPILRDVALKVHGGETLGVIGESGSGKSMTALAVMGLLPRGSQVSGRIELDSADLLAKSETEMCRVRGQDIGMVFQEPMTALNPLQTIGDQVAETVRVHTRSSRSEAMEIARETLDRVGLPAREFPLGRYPHELSGGQRQRVVIAMAVALRPKLLVADEPTTALDVTTQAQILDLLKGLVVEQGMGLILITHDLAVVADLADHLAIMNAGRVVEAGATRDVLTQMRHPYTRALFAASSHQPVRRPRIARKTLLQVEGVVREYPLPRKGLFARHDTFCAVKGVSFELRRGESLGLVGESGCGKSTLTRAILGLDLIQAGRVVLDGEEVHAARSMPTRLRAMVQAVFQDPYGSFNPRHRVSRLVSEPFHLLQDAPKGAARRRSVEVALEAVGLLPEDADKFIHEFSGGQRQRIAIARALIIRPALIVLDEAVSALDVSIRAQILDLLSDLSDEFGLSYLFVSHDLNVVRAITDRVMVMRAGEIVEAGPTEAVFEVPRHPYTRALLEAAPSLERIARSPISTLPNAT